jgi:phosphoribosylaminoimidazole-succinocarboxamide synthase
MSSGLTTTSLPLTLIAKGKVRDVYDAGQGTLLFVATDRISAFDIVLENVSVLFESKCMLYTKCISLISLIILSSFSGYSR